MAYPEQPNSNEAILVSDYPTHTQGTQMQSGTLVLAHQIQDWMRENQAVIEMLGTHGSLHFDFADYNLLAVDFRGNQRAGKEFRTNVKHPFNRTSR